MADIEFEVNSGGLGGGDGNDSFEGDDGDNTIEGLGGDDQLIGGEGNDTLVGGEGDDTYIFNRGDGQDHIDNVGDAVTGADVVAFGSDVNTDQLWFSQSGDDLLVEIIGTSDDIIIDDWYLSSNNRVAEFEASDGSVLVAADVETLVSAMAAFSPPALGELDLTQAHVDGNLDDTIAATWQTGG